MNEPDIRREVLDNLEDGVLVVGLAGRIETLNPTAGRILGLEAGETEGRSFAELFITREGFDDFTPVLLDTTLEGAAAKHRVVRVERGGVARSLSVATSWLRRGDTGETVAAIAVFSDVAELRELRETELRLAKAAREQHQRLQAAYRKIADRSAALASALRKVRVVQGLGMVLAVGLFLGADFWTTRWLALFDGVSAAAAILPAGEGRRMTVQPRRVSDGITLRAGQKVTVTGNAFLGLSLEGEVTHVSFQAAPWLRGIPKFDVKVTVGTENAARLRSGMSARLRIVTYNNPKALSVPIAAVESRGGAHRLRVVDPATGEIEERQVEVGRTARDTVEIRAGLNAGETILAPGG